MYKTFYGLEINPFVKELKTEYCYESKDYNEVKGRLKYLKEIKGIGLFIGSSGLGKTFSIRCFTENLNKDLYKVIYISPTKLRASILISGFKNSALCAVFCAQGKP